MTCPGIGAMAADLSSGRMPVRYFDTIQAAIFSTTSRSSPL
jgi:hypothetical protein